MLNLIRGSVWSDFKIFINMCIMKTVHDLQVIYTHINLPFKSHFKDILMLPFIPILWHSLWILKRKGMFEQQKCSLQMFFFKCLCCCKCTFIKLCFIHMHQINNWEWSTAIVLVIYYYFKIFCVWVKWTFLHFIICSTCLYSYTTIVFLHFSVGFFI